MPTILIKKSDTPGAAPTGSDLTNLAGGAEIAVNTADKRVFSMNSSSAIIELGTNPGSLTTADASATVLRSGSATITDLIATSASITTLTATSASVTNLTATSLVLSNLSIASANVTTLTSASATITNLIATTATVSDLSATVSRSASATITNLIATSGSVSDLSATVSRAGSATITNLTATSASVTNLTATSATISNFTFTSATVTRIAATSATVSDLSATVSRMGSATVTNLIATSGSVSDLSATVTRSASATITNLLATSLTVSSGSTLNGGVVVNETGADVDFRIESDTSANAFFLDGATGNVGIGTTNLVGEALGANGKSLSMSIASDINGGNNVSNISSNAKLISLSGIAGPSNYTAATMGIHQPGTTEGVGDFRFSTGDGAGNLTERLRIDSSGGLITKPAAGGHAVFNEDGVDSDFRIESDTDTHAFFVRGSDGNIGVGASAPTRNLEVSRSASQASVRVTGSNNGTTTNSRASYGSIIEVQNTDTTEGNLTGLWHLNPAGTGRGAVAFQGTGTDSTDVNLLFITGGTAAERMRITSDGELLVGGTTVVDTTGWLGGAATQLNVQSAGGGYITLYRDDTSVTTGDFLGGIAFYGKDTTSNTPTLHASIQAVASGGHAAGDNPTDISFFTTPNNTATAAEAGRITQAGSYVLKGGTTTAAAGVGIIFPATQVASANANSLDDYEEGTWTPAFHDDESLGLTYSQQVGTYTKIGRIVHAKFRITVSAKTGTSAQGFFIKSLPFFIGYVGTTVSTAMSVINAVGNLTDVTNPEDMSYKSFSANAGLAYFSSSAGTLTASDINSNTFIEGILIYQV